MRGGTLFSWLLLAVFSAWAASLQGLLARGSWLGAWAPDLTLALLLSLSAYVQRGDLPALVLAVALGRCAVSIEPPAAVLAGFLGAALAARGIRSVIDIGSSVPRAALAFACALALEAWMGLAHEARALEAAGALAGALPRTWSEHQGAFTLRTLVGALSTAACALALGPALARLPGLSPLRRRKVWHVTASRR